MENTDLFENEVDDGEPIPCPYCEGKRAIIVRRISGHPEENGFQYLQPCMMCGGTGEL
jgi:hypothetical protein